MMLGQHGANKHPEQCPSEDAREHDPTDGHGITIHPSWRHHLWHQRHVNEDPVTTSDTSG